MTISTETKNDFTNTINVLNYELTSGNNNAKKLTENLPSIIITSINVFNNEKEIAEFQGKNKKDFRAITTAKNGLIEVYSKIHKLGKNHLKAFKIIGENPINVENGFKDASEKGTKVVTVLGLKKYAILDSEKVEKSIEEIIENFIKSNTTKKEDDEKVNILEITLMFNKIAEKMHKEKNSNIVDFLPTEKDIAING